MDNILSKKYIDITLNNTSNLPINIDFSKENSTNIVDDASQYDLSIIRFKIPSSGISRLIIPANSTDYMLYMRKNGFLDGTNILSKSVIQSFNLADTSDVAFREPKEFIDYINRSISECYYRYLLALAPAQVSATQLSFSFNNTNTVSQVFSFPSFPTILGINYVKLNFALIANSTQKILHGLKVYLIIKGVECLILQNPDYTSTNELNAIVFSDGYHVSSDASYIGGLQDERYPKEPLFKLYDSAGISGTDFSIRVECSNTFPSNDLQFTINANLTLSVTLQNKLFSPKYTPYFSIDSNNFLTFNYSQNWAQYGPFLGFSPKLRNMIDNFEYMAFDNVEYLNLPSQTLTASETIDRSITQLQSSLYLFNQINKLEFTSIIPVEFESVGGSSTSSILTDFAIDTAGISSDYFIYNASSDYRKYRLLSNTPLKKLQFTGYVVYNDGTRRILTIRPGETSNLKIQLSPI
jgi:hypothetical protein